jgi:hypothetical protein
METVMPGHNEDDHAIRNSASDPDIDMRRSGGTPDDPHGGHEAVAGEWKGPNPDPIDELLPAGTKAAGIESLAYSDIQQPNQPAADIDSDAGVHRLTPGPGRLEGPVERAENLFSIDPVTHLPRLKA